MKKYHIFPLIALLVFALALSACGKEEAPATAPAAQAAPAEMPAPGPLALTDWTMSASTWSSPNGATVHINATPSRYLEGESASFIVRLEGEEISNVPCEWDGKQYTAAAELNAANDYCYYIVLKDASGAALEVAVNTPAAPYDERLINMEDALNSYCTVTVDESTTTENALILNSGSVQVQAPKIGNDGQLITCVDVLLILSLNGEEIAKEALVMQGTDDVGFYSMELSDVSFELPKMEGDQQLFLDLKVTLSNGQVLNAPGGVWYNSDNGFMTAVG